MKDDLELGGEVGYINLSDLPDKLILETLREQREFARVEKWVDSWKGSSRRRNSTPFNQDKYTIPPGIFDQFRVAAEAAKYDDVVANAIEVTEQLAFKRIGVECGDDALNNIASQIIDELDLVQRMREMWRELFVISQCYVAVRWGRKTYRAKGTHRESGRPMKSVKNLLVPTGISLLDPLKIIPVGNFLFGDERLVYVAGDAAEASAITSSIAGINTSDLTVKSLFIGKYSPRNEYEMSDISELVGDDYNISDRLFELNPDNVWRITSTRPSYQRFADVRLTSVFELLDLKHNLRESDRSDILGNLHCIVLVKKGDDKRPATEEELSAVYSKMKSNSRNSLMISDHRIDIEILTKKTNFTLQPERHNTLDARITARLFQVLQTGNYCMTPDTEALTRSGWKTHDQLTVGEEIYSIDTETGLGKWTPILKINTFDYHGPMLSLESRGHSSMSTPNHRWWIERSRGKDKIKGMEWTTSEDMKIHDRIPVAAPNADFPLESIYTDELVELAAWFWTEGHRKNDAPNRISISQSITANPHKCDRIRHCLEKVFGPEGKVSDGGNWYYSGEEFNVSAAVTQPLLELFEHEWVPVKDRETKPKRPRLDFIYGLTQEQLQLFVDTCVAGDGNIESARSDVCHSRTRWHQKDYRSIEIFDLCLAMLGVPTRHRLDTSKEKAGVWTTEFLSRDFTSPIAAARAASQIDSDNPTATAEWVPYSGTVWCPTTETGTWFARRNGISFMTGNSAGTAVDDSAKLFKVIAASMEARRDMIRDAVMDNIIEKIWERNDALKGDPEMTFYPRRIALDFDPNYSQLIFDLFSTGDISRQTMLDEIDLNQEIEAFRREREDMLYSDIFIPKLLPGQGQAKVDGRLGGGNKNGGGLNSDSGKPSPSDQPNDPRASEVKKSQSEGI